jgi:predicted metalloprotease
VGNPLYKGELDSGQSSQAGKSDASQNLLSVKNQLQARYLLGRYYMQQDMITEAGKALQTGDLKPPFHSSESDGYYYQIVQLRAELEKKLAGVEGVK